MLQILGTALLAASEQRSGQILKTLLSARAALELWWPFRICLDPKGPEFFKDLYKELIIRKPKNGGS